MGFLTFFAHLEPHYVQKLGSGPNRMLALCSDIKYSYIIQIICTKLYGFDYSYLIISI